MNVKDIREALLHKYTCEEFVQDKTGVKTVELIGSSFRADEPSIFGKVNEDYCMRELAWYLGGSLYVDEIPGETPAIWNKISSEYGAINSNYGWCIFSPENGYQFYNVLKQLKENPDSRRAQMIYTRPTMHEDYKTEGMSDFMCTSCTYHFIRDDKLQTIVSMRSNDAWAGYRNDYFWQKFVHDMLAAQLGIEVGNITWQAASLHVYESQFYLLDHYAKTGQWNVTKGDITDENGLA